MFIQNTPQMRLLVNNSYCGVKKPFFEEAYLIAVTSIASESLYFTVHLESGAVWQRLPIEALLHKHKLDKFIKNEELQPYSCLDGDINVIEYNHLKSYQCFVRPLNLYGEYKFTVDVKGSGLASDPVQHKTHNIIALSNGQFGAFPNNMLEFKDNYFTNSKPTPNYSRVDKRYFPGG